MGLQAALGPHKKKEGPSSSRTDRTGFLRGPAVATSVLLQLTSTFPSLFLPSARWRETGDTCRAMLSCIRKDQYSRGSGGVLGPLSSTPSLDT